MVIQNCNGFTFLHLVIGFENSHHTLKPIRCKIKNKCDRVISVFPRFKRFACFQFSNRVYLFSDWLL